MFEVRIRERQVKEFHLTFDDEKCMDLCWVLVSLGI